MPLSKARNRERMRKSRLHGKNAHRNVQPKPYNKEVDADGNAIPDYD